VESLGRAISHQDFAQPGGGRSSKTLQEDAVLVFSWSLGTPGGLGFVAPLRGQNASLGNWGWIPILVFEVGHGSWLGAALSIAAGWRSVYRVG
jgi:hypothetical protein